MTRRHASDDRMGFADYCRVDKAGKVTCGGSDDEMRRSIEGKVGKPKFYKSKRNKEGKLQTDTATDTGTDGWTAAGSPLFTSTSKVHAPTFGLTAGATCPSVQYPVMKWLKEAVTHPERKGLHNAKDVITRLQKEIPEKCLACYATQSSYTYAETKQAMARRQLWWNSTSDKEIEDTLVYAIQHAGDEKCTPKGCKFTPGVQTHRFRAFDSGDFQSPRDVRIWTKVVKRLPGTKFWFPTTTAAGLCHATPKLQQEMLSTLRELHKEPNATVRPSARAIDAPALHIDGLGAGTSVVEPKPTEERQYSRGGKSRSSTWVDICDVKDGKKKCRSHFICPGDCGTCPNGGMCWSKHAPVVYKRHGLEATSDRIVNLVRRTTGTEAYNRDLPGTSKPTAYKHEEVNSAMREEFGRLFAKMWPGPTEQWRGVVERALPMQSGNEREAERKGMSLAEYERELAGKKAAKAAQREEKIRLKREWRANQIAARAAR